MGFFTKDKEEKKADLPKLPGLPELPELPQTTTTTQSFPTYQPKDAQQLQFTPSSQAGLEAIKNSVIDNQLDSRKFEPPEKRTMELSDMTPSSSFRRTNSKEPLFIKIDKFQDMVEKFEEIKKKVSDIENSSCSPVIVCRMADRQPLC